MKVLLIGMDGCHKEVFERGWTPFISRMLEKQRHLDIENDLLSRGWLEISLGEHAKRTTALYDKPKANGSLEWSTEFSMPQVPDLGIDIKSLWQKLNEQGASIGVVNVPTTFPAPEVNGFFISGGGGGAPVTEAATEALCYPKDIVPLLTENGYIVDDRLYQLVVEKKLDTPAKILKRLTHKNDRRTASFLALNERFDVDFGFIVYKTASVITETLFNAEQSRRRNSQNKPDEDAINAIRAYYEAFDNQIRKLVEQTSSSEVIFVSDHGTTKRTHSVNPNILLQEHRLQEVESKRYLTKQMVSKLKENVPFWLKYYLKKTAAKTIKGIGATNFNPVQTSAFCITTGDWCHGIYINDQKRFGGPVRDCEVGRIRDRIIELINSSADARAHGISASASDAGMKFDHFPDIQLSLPNGYLTFDKATAFISEFIPPSSKTSLASVMRGDILSMKSHAPLAYMDEDIAATFKDEHLRGDLTVIHHRILDLMER